MAMVDPRVLIPTAWPWRTKLPLKRIGKEALDPGALGYLISINGRPPQPIVYIGTMLLAEPHQCNHRIYPNLETLFDEWEVDS